MNADKDYYGILGVLPTAPLVVIRAAYKALIQRYHPDRNANSRDAHDKTSLINEAYSILSDSEKRKEYDRLRNNRTGHPDAFFSEDFESSSFDNDPLEEKWAIATKYRPKLDDVAAQLGKVSWRLAYSFRAFLLETQEFNKYDEIARQMESEFLQLHFGKEKQIIYFAKYLIKHGYKDAARELNKVMNVFGPSADVTQVINTISREYHVDYPSALTERQQTMAKEEDQLVMKLSSVQPVIWHSQGDRGSIYAQLKVAVKEKDNQRVLRLVRSGLNPTFILHDSDREIRDALLSNTELMFIISVGSRLWKKRILSEDGIKQ